MDESTLRRIYTTPIVRPRSQLTKHLGRVLQGLTLTLLILLAISTPVGSNMPLSQTLSLVQIANGKVVNQNGVRVYLDGLNYKDEFKWLLYEKNNDASDWVTVKSDFATMASLGAKTIRVWFQWNYYERTLGQLDSRRMLSDIQKIVDASKASGLYVIITMYVKDFWIDGVLVKNWLQAHTTTAHTDPNSPDFWLNDGDYPAKQREVFINLWRTISWRFKNEPVIAAYDLINEPYNKYYAQLPQWAQSMADNDPHYPLKSLYDLVVKSVRNSGDKHIIILDYNWVYSAGLVPLARPSQDRQLLYDIHMYYAAPESQVQGWDVNDRIDSPWRGKTPTGQEISYGYPDTASGHDKAALRSRLETLVQAQLKGYVFYIGEFGFTENREYNADIANLVLEFGFAGFLYFEFVPDEPIGTVQLIQPIMTYVRR